MDGGSDDQKVSPDVVTPSAMTATIEECESIKLEECDYNVHVKRDKEEFFLRIVLRLNLVGNLMDLTLLGHENE